jgi:hypothetical protein
MLNGRRAHSLQRTIALYELTTGEITIFISYEGSVYVWNCINYPRISECNVTLLSVSMRSLQPISTVI